MATRLIRLAAFLPVLAGVVLLGVVLPGVLPAARADDEPPAPVCRSATVMDVMAREMRLRAYYVEIDPTLIDEAPTADPRRMHCGVCVIVYIYDTARFGDVPVARCEPHEFSVLAVRNGFVVRFVQ